MYDTFVVNVNPPAIEGGIWDGTCQICGRIITAHDIKELNENAKFHYDTKHKSVQTETIAEEASRIVYGDREKTYDDPNRNFRKLAYIIQGILDGKLKDDARITPNDAALILVGLKISRESFKPTRENRVDGIGYWICLDRIVLEQEKADGPVKLTRNNDGSVVFGMNAPVLDDDDV